MADVTLTTVEALVRYILNDSLQTMIPGDVFVYGNSSVFTLSESNVVSVSAVFVNDVALSTGSYSFNSSTGKLTITYALVVGDTVEVQYTYYPNYSSTEIASYIRSALVQLSINNYETYTVETSTIYPEPEEFDKNLIAAITAILIKPGNMSYSLPDVRISVPSDLPTDMKIKRLISNAKLNTHGVFDITNQQTI